MSISVRAIDSIKLAAAFERVAAHEHLCLPYETDEERIDVVSPLVRLGLERNEKCLYITNEPHGILTALQAREIDTEAAIQSGALCITAWEDVFPGQTCFSPDTAGSFVIDMAQRAKDEGFPVLRVMLEITQLWEDGPDTAHLMTYEAQLAKAAAASDTLIVCLYDRRRCKPAIMLNAIRAHPVIMIRGAVCQNFQYLPPDEFLLPDWEASEVDRLVAAIWEQSQSKNAFQQIENRFRRLTEDIGGHDEMQRFHEVFEKSRLLAVGLDMQGNIMLCNDHLLDLTGWQRGEILGKDWVELFLPADARDTTRQLFTYAIQSDEIETPRETTILTKDGESRLIRWNNAILHDYQGEIMGTASIGEDVTEYRQTEEALHESERRYRTLFESASDAIFVHNMEGHFLDANHIACERLGYSREELLALSAMDINAPHYATLVPARIRGLQKCGSGLFETVHTRRDGTQIPTELNCQVVQYNDQSVILCHARDITARKQAEIESEAVSVISQMFLSFETLEDVYRDLPVMLSAYFQFPVATISLLDQSAEEMVLVGVSGVPQTDAKPTRVPISQTVCGVVISTGKAVVELDVGQRTEQHFQWLKEIGLSFFLCVPMQVGGRIIGTLGLGDRRPPQGIIPRIETFKVIGNHLAQEIERKNAEEALRESEERYRLIAENMNDLVWLMDANLVTTFISPSATRMRGYTEEELKSMPLEKHLKSSSLDSVIKMLAEEWQSENPIYNTLPTSRTMELEFYCQDGSTLWSEVTLSLIRDNEGKPSRVLGVGRDITDRKQAEDALRAGERKYRQLVENLNEGIWAVDQEAITTFVNPRMAEMLGYQPDEMIGRNLFDFTTEQGSENNRKDLERRKQGIRDEADSEFVHKDGSTIYARVLGAPIIDETGSYCGVIAGVMDITARRRAEEAEREQRTLAEALRDTAIALNSTLSLDEVFDRILANVGQVVPHDTASIMLIEEGTGRVVKTRGFVERGLQDWLLMQQFPVAEIPSMKRMVETKQPVLIPSTQIEPTWIIYPENDWIRSYIGAPIVIEEQAIGFIHLDNAIPDAFSANHAERLGAFAEHAAVAIHNAQHYEAEHYERVLAETLHEIAESLASSAPLERTLDLIITRLEQILRCDWATIMLVQADFLHVMVARGFPEQANILEQTYLYPTIPLFYESMTLGQPIAISNAQEDPRWMAVPGFEMPAGGWIGVPIVIRDVVIGILTAGATRPRQYTERDMKTVAAFAQHAALAFESTQVYSELESSLSDVRNLKAHMLRTAQLHVAGEIATGVAHQVNNPLTTIIAESHLLLKQLPPNSTYYESADSIREAAYRAGTVVQRLLDFARSKPYSLQPLDINFSIEHAISLVRAQIEPHIARVVVNLAPDLPLVEASEEHLEDVWINLLLNARDAVHKPGSGLITITTKCNARDETVEVTVQDNGMGIPEDQVERIFTPFHTTKEHGTGLGLPICREVVARHGGTIHVNSQTGKGAKFIVSLPSSKNRI
ncbi:MAG: PAS domain S-box protein [Anaerolineae bacterium]|nr:PAS domain S-box protein [Anaerolineae bacterium]